MSKDAFWALIQEAKTACGQDLNAMEDYLREQLVSMGPAAAKNFHDILQTYEDLADQYGLWDAVSVIKEYGCEIVGAVMSCPGPLDLVNEKIITPPNIRGDWYHLPVAQKLRDMIHIPVYLNNDGNLASPATII